MSLQENIKLALSAIRSNLLRTVLTFLIIAFGIMALVGILTSIDSIKGTISSEFGSIGANTFNIIRAGTGVQGGRRGKPVNIGASIRFQEALHFKENYGYPSVVSVSALASSGALIKREQEETNPNITIYGVDENYMDVAGYQIQVGRNFTSNETIQGRNIIILGKAVVERLFPKKAAYAVLGETVTIKNIAFTIVGVLKEKGSSLAFSGDRIVFIPLMTLRKYFGAQTNSYNLSVSISRAIDMDEAVAEAEGVMRQIRRIPFDKEADFEIQKSDNLLQILDDNTATIQLAAIFIGLVTLLGAAIGLMNIMLVSVTERTREIGICKSLGDRKSVV